MSTDQDMCVLETFDTYAEADARRFYWAGQLKTLRLAGRFVIGVRRYAGGWGVFLREG